MRTFYLSLLLLVTLNGCVDADPFGLRQRDIVGDYALKQWEDFTTYYLEDSKKEYEDFPDHGPIGGTVVQIGWDDDYIVIQRNAHFGGTIDEWMIVDVSTKEVRGPFDWEELMLTEELGEIEIHKAADAWELL